MDYLKISSHRKKIKENRENLHALEDIIKKPKIMYYKIPRRKEKGAGSLFKETKLKV